MPDVHMSIEKKSKPEIVQSRKGSENDDENNNITENSEQNKPLQKVNTWKELTYLEDQVDLERNPFV
jgi:hypothetical protein